MSADVTRPCETRAQQWRAKPASLDSTAADAQDDGIDPSDPDFWELVWPVDVEPLPFPEDALADLTEIVHQEVRALVDEGVSYVQIDSIRYVFDFADEFDFVYSRRRRL